MKTIFLYAGQGSQKVGMGKDLYEEYAAYRQVVDNAKVPFDAKALMEQGPLETLSDTRYTQACMALYAAGVTAVLAEQGVLPDAACGLSLGEYGALYAAGAMNLETYVEVLVLRGRVMAEAATGTQCAMSAILGMEASVVEQACEVGAEAGFVTVANYNCPGQYVICGDEGAVQRTEAHLREQGAKRCVRLNVSGPFHTKYMSPAGEALKEYFQKNPLMTPKIPVYLNVTGAVYEETQNLADLLVHQVQSSVRLEDALRQMLAEDDVRFVEIGPGNTMAGFLKKTARAMGKDVQVVSVETVADVQKLTAVEA